jgi:hypothetical protein
VIAAGSYALYAATVPPFKEKARAALEAYADAQRRGVAPPLPAYAATPERIRADQIVARSTSLDVEVGHWRMGSGDIVCFQGKARGPSGDEPIIAGVSRDGETYRVDTLLSRAGCECSDHEERFVDCP